MSVETEYLLHKTRVAAGFSAAAGSYDAHALLQSTVAARMLERLDLVRLQPRRILDLGAGTGVTARALGRRYHGARVFALDIALGMLRQARRRRRWLRGRHSYLCADAEAIPLAPGSIDLVFSNLMLQWCNALDSVFDCCRSVLSPGGLLLFSTLGPDTLCELRRAWRAVDRYSHVSAFIDMHDIGDALIRAGFSSPVLDVEHIVMTYPDVRALVTDLKKIGAHNATAGRPRTLTGPRRWQRFVDAYEVERVAGRLPATFEVVYGHAWAPLPGTRSQDGSTVSAAPVHFLPRRKT